MSIPLSDPASPTEVEVKWSYWPVNYAFGDPTVISNSPLPLSGVSMSETMRGVGELKATLQLADEEVRALNPWDKVVPRKTGIVAVREVLDPVARVWTATPIQHYVVWSAPRDPATGRMSISAQTVESLWARRLITREIIWDNVDQTTIAANLLNPAIFSQVAVGANPWPGWINIDPPVTNTGVLRDFTYDENQETNLLAAHKDRSQVIGGYEWRTSVRVLSGVDAVSAASFRVQFVLGYPQLGRRLGDLAGIPRLRYDREGAGNVLEVSYPYDGTDVPNIVWGRGNGYEELQVRSLAINTEWNYGFLQSEDRFSDPDVKEQATLDDKCLQRIDEALSGERYITGLTIRGDRPPYFGSYVIGDDLILETNDLTWPPDFYDANGFLALTSRIFGWVINPPQGDQSEKIKLVLAGGDV